MACSSKCTKCVLVFCNALFFAANLAMAIVFGVYIFGQAPGDGYNIAVQASLVGLSLTFFLGMYAMCKSKMNKCLAALYTAFLTVFVLLQLALCISMLVDNEYNDVVFDAISGKFCEGSDALAIRVMQHEQHDTPWYCCCGECAPTASDSDTAHPNKAAPKPPYDQSGSWAVSTVIHRRAKATNNTMGSGNASTANGNSSNSGGGECVDATSHTYARLQEMKKAWGAHETCRPRRKCVHQSLESSGKLKLAIALTSLVLVLEVLMIVFACKLTFFRKTGVAGDEWFISGRSDITLSEMNAADALAHYDDAMRL